AESEEAPAGVIVRRHAADGGARRGGNIDREPESVWLEPAIQVVEDDAGLDRAAPVADVDLVDLREVFGAVDDQRFVHRLPGLRGAAAARQHAHALLAREFENALSLCDRARRD